MYIIKSTRDRRTTFLRGGSRFERAKLQTRTGFVEREDAFSFLDGVLVDPCDLPLDESTTAASHAPAIAHQTIYTHTTRHARIGLMSDRVVAARSIHASSLLSI